MYKHCFDHTGKLVKVCLPDPNVPFADEGDYAFISDLPAANTNCYYSLSKGKVLDVPKPSKRYEVFNTETETFEDPRSLDDVKFKKWEIMKLQRNALEFGGFEFEGNVYDSDQVSQGRIMGAVAAGVDQVWTLADNTTVELSALQLQQLYVALQMHVASVHERGRIARQLIYGCETKEEVEAVQL